MALGGTEGNASSPAIAAGANGPWVAWLQISDGTQGLYVAEYINGTWTAFGGSATNAGLSLPGSSASNPSIAVIGGVPVVAWTSTTSAGTAIEVATYSATANGGAGGWVGLGNSYSATGISGVGNFDNAQIVETASGPVVTWRDLAGATPVLYAMRFNGTTWSALGAGAASGSGIAGSSGVTPNYALATDGAQVAVAFSTVTSYGTALQVLQYSGAVWSALASPNPGPAATGNNSFSTDPSLAYFGGKLYLAWTQQDQTTLYLPRIYVESETGGAWSPAGTGAAGGFGVAPNDQVSGHAVLTASGSTLSLLWVATVVTPSGPTENLAPDVVERHRLRRRRSPRDIAGTGIGQVAGIPRTLALTIDASGRAVARLRNLRRHRAHRAGRTRPARRICSSRTARPRSPRSLRAAMSAAGDLILVTAPNDGHRALTLGAADRASPSPASTA